MSSIFKSSSTDVNYFTGTSSHKRFLDVNRLPYSPLLSKFQIQLRFSIIVIWNPHTGTSLSINEYPTTSQPTPLITVAHSQVGRRQGVIGCNRGFEQGKLSNSLLQERAVFHQITTTACKVKNIPHVIPLPKGMLLAGLFIIPTHHQPGRVGHK